MTLTPVSVCSPASANSSSSLSSSNTTAGSFSTSPSTPLSSYPSPKSTTTTPPSNTFTTRPPYLPPLPGPLRYVQLPNKSSSTARIAYCYRLVTASAWVSLSVETPLGLPRPHILIVFVNGVDTTQSSWTLAIARYQSVSTLYTGRRASTLTFDRCGEGLSRDEAEGSVQAEAHHSATASLSRRGQGQSQPTHSYDPLKGHVEDLRFMVETVLAERHSSAHKPSSNSARTPPSRSPTTPHPFTQLDRTKSPFNIIPETSPATSVPPLILVAHGHEIGIPIAKRFTETYPDDVAGLLLLHDDAGWGDAAFAMSETTCNDPPTPTSKSADLALSLSSMDIAETTPTSSSDSAASGAETAEQQGGSRWGGTVRELRGIDSLSWLPNSELVGNELGAMVQRILGLG